jgi:hypothetical protein
VDKGCVICTYPDCMQCMDIRHRYWIPTLNCYLELGSDKKADPLFVYKYFLFVKFNLVTRGSSINLDQKGF